ncbi:MAG: GNAT family N-acetyltransferase [Cyanobacteriota bacterium]
MYGIPAAACSPPATPAPPPTNSLASPILQPLRPEEIDHCLRLDQRCLGGLWSRPQWSTELMATERPGLGLWRAELLLAMACGWLILEELHITLVAVDPEQRRHGLGRRVLEALLAEAQRRGAERATLEVASGNEAARRLYGRAGFREAGRRRGYYRNGDDALIQWRELEP